MSVGRNGEHSGRAAVFCSRYLAYSQTFIYEEIRQHVRYEVEVFCRGLLNPGQFPFHPVHTAGLLYPYTRYSRRFLHILAQRPFHLVHAHFGTVGITAMYYARRRNLPLVVTFHGRDVPLLRSAERWMPKHWGYAALSPRLLRTMTLGLCASRELLEMLVGFGVPRDRLRLHPIGIDVEAISFRPPRGRPARVVMVGRFVEKKGFTYGLRAFARGSRDLPARLTIVGGGALEPRLRALVQDLGLSDRVEFAGILPHSRVLRLLEQSDILLAPSVVTRRGDRESGLMVVKEAGAAGAVAVGTVHGGIPEIIDDGVTGFLVPERDVAAMAERLRLLLSDEELRIRLARAARRKMEREYDNTHRVAALEERYDEARRIHARGTESRRR
ncbi:MAG: glycosyltransferase [Gemmatimonadota bacterium]